MQWRRLVVAAIRGGGGSGGGRIWVLGFDFVGRKGWVLGLGESDIGVWEKKRDFAEASVLGLGFEEVTGFVMSIWWGEIMRFNFYF